MIRRFFRHYIQVPYYLTFKYDTSYDSLGVRHIKTDTTVNSKLYWMPDNFGPCYCYAPSVECGAEISVHSQRYTTLRYEQIAIMDSIADMVLSGLSGDLASGLASGIFKTKQTISQTTVPSLILNEAKAVDKSTNNQRKYYYLCDEMQISQFAAAGRVNNILKNTAISELQGHSPEINRYLTVVQPVTYWQGGGFGTGGYASRAAFADNGYLNKIYNGIDSINSTSASINSSEVTALGGIVSSSYEPGHDSTTCTIVGDGGDNGEICTNWQAVLPFSTMQSYKGVPYGYYSTSEPDSIGTNFQKLQPYDYSTTGQAQWGNGYTAPHNAVTIPPFQSSGVKNWWADIFDYGFADAAAGHGFLTEMPAIPEQLNVTSNMALAFGATGLTYYLGRTEDRGDSIKWLGFTDEAGIWSLDSTQYAGNWLPTMFHRNCLWAQKFSGWLKKYAGELRNSGIAWQGGFVRSMNRSGCDGSDNFDTNSFGNLKSLIRRKIRRDVMF